ncbi:dihydrolipoamide acetyltransferase family protein [Conexibacter sp. CPCC 206217]|uniref:dihydrolipoamide acetyltransferase family protein n=1 Tax=Conexibacter sp. CPCC 206217 TaxID=3064574 RepID=UPI0027252BDC|nr:dihydrolipoamide acetyltransferase family protein [Conexibacter sp. CPCC 206217]MDO8210150.1 dihydrolipoamide acetyltransferase family protein [Conexibacter sp. CPCC 206217]
MITAVVMPQMGLEVTEGTVSALLVEVGARVSQDDALLELETDKATTDVVAPCDGVVRAFTVAVGDTIPVGATLVQLADSAEESLAGTGEGEPASASGTVAESGAQSAGMGVAIAALAPAESVSAQAPGGRDRAWRRAAPVARRAAAALGIALDQLDGTGPRGRITLRDVERAAAGHGAADADGTAVGNGVADANAIAVTATATAPPSDDVAIEQPSALRRAIARRMSESQTIPQFQLVRDVDATHLLQRRAALVADVAAGAARPGVNDLLVQAIAETAVRHPLLATSWVERDGELPLLQRRQSIGVGIAVATERGLVVPVVRDVPHAGIAEIAAQRTQLVAAARAGRLALEQMRGGAITLSSLAGFGVSQFSAMVNPGESAIVAAGRVTDTVVVRGRTLAIVPTLTLTVSFDHRVVDGAAGAEALTTLVALLEGELR